MPSSVPHVRCAGGIVFDAAGRLLVVRRGRPPAQGSWSIPGGRCEPGESAADACVREVAEETGLVVEVQRWAGRVERAAPAAAAGRVGRAAPAAAAGRVERAAPTAAAGRVERAAPAAAAGRVGRAAPAAAVYDIDDFVCAVRGGTLAAADDAADARWVAGAEFGALRLAPLLYETLRDWDCLPRC